VDLVGCVIGLALHQDGGGRVLHDEVSKSLLDEGL
jgi:hypothetical protein